MDVARLNFSHGSYKHHSMLIKNVRKAAKSVGVPVAIMQDLQGPKIRIGDIGDEGIKIKKGENIILTCGPKSKTKIPVQYKKLYKITKKGNILLVDDGLIELKVVAIKGKDIHCKAQNNSVINSNKGINVPDASITVSPITPKDKKDLLFGLKNDIDYVALSFVAEAKNIHDLRKIIKNRKKNVKIVAKIERKSAIENLEEIIEASDALMVARGDLGMEIGPEKVPIVQKEMIRLCNLAGKPVITATHMLQSMVSSPKPTRAEVSDTANAIFDHSDAIMLSNETAVGNYPIRAIKMFADTAKAVENELIKHNKLLPIRDIPSHTFLYDALGYHTCKLAETIKADNIIILSASGKSARFVSKHRSYIPTIVITNSEKTRNQLALQWGLNKIMVAKLKNKKSIDELRKLLIKKNCMKKGQKAVVLHAMSDEKHIVSLVV
jgi:pyruvate kinase